MCKRAPQAVMQYTNQRMVMSLLLIILHNNSHYFTIHKYGIKCETFNLKLQHFLPPTVLSLSPCTGSPE